MYYFIFLKVSKHKKNDLLDFYNIMLETHKNDPKGYYLLVKLIPKF